MLSSTVSRVERAPVPATTGTRPAAASTVTSTSARRSPLDSVVNSPVLPPGTSPPTPAPISRSTSARSAPASISAPSGVNGVISAGSTPLKTTGWLPPPGPPAFSYMGHLSDSGVDAFGDGAAGLRGGLHGSQLGEVIARQVQVLVGAECALKGALQRAATTARVHVAELPPLDRGAGDDTAGLRVQPVQVGQEALDDHVIARAQQRRRGPGAGEEHQAPARTARPGAQRVGLVGEHVEHAPRRRDR